MSAPKIAALESFPTLKPAFRLKVGSFLLLMARRPRDRDATDRSPKTWFGNSLPCGDIHTGEALFVSACGLGHDGSVLESVEGYEPRVSFAIRHCVDHFTVDANKTHGRVDARSALVDDQGRAVEMLNTGLIAINESTLPLIQKVPGAKSAPFGDGRTRLIHYFTVEVFRFRTGHEEYKVLENKIFVASKRYTYIDGKVTGVETRLSEVISGTGME